eukprot:m.30036 g.30036  ORF g.30036 m.30036 type:complete len:264 (+) comp4736_c0_seq1:1365-2156(+)
MSVPQRTRVLIIGAVLLALSLYVLYSSFYSSELQPIARAQYGEDLYAMRTFFPDRMGGTILESGALDGLKFSTSYFFVNQRGWQAVHVEPSPVSFKNLAKNRPESINVNAALCERESTIHYIGPEKAASSGAVGGIIEFMSPGTLDKHWPKDSHGVRHGLYGGGKAIIYPIQCRRLDSILSNHSIGHVDLWILDVEGAELAVLHTIDLAKVRIDVLGIELDGSNKEKDDGVVEHLLANGYKVHSKFPPQNTWFVRDDFLLPSQ